MTVRCDCFHFAFKLRWASLQNLQVLVSQFLQRVSGDIFVDVAVPRFTFARIRNLKEDSRVKLRKRATGRSNTNLPSRPFASYVDTERCHYCRPVLETHSSQVETI